MSVVSSLTSFGTLKYDSVIKATEMLSFLPPVNNSVTTEFSFLFLIMSAIIINQDTLAYPFLLLFFLFILLVNFLENILSYNI